MNEDKLIKSTEQYARTSGELYKMISSDMESSESKELIRLHQLKLIADANLLKEELKLSYAYLESKEGNTQFLDNVVNISLSYVAGYISRKMLVGNSKNIFRQLSGFAVELIIANEVYKNAEKIKAVGGKMMDKIMNKQ